MNRRALVVALVVCGLAPALLERAALRTASDDPHHHGFLDRSLVSPQRTLLPGLRALFVQLWLIRIDVAIDRGDRVAALRFAREALAVGPDLAIARARIASVVAFEVAASARTSTAQAPWIGEALRILDEGIARDSGNADLHFERGRILWLRGMHVEAFAKAYEQSEKKTTLEAGADSLLHAARLAPFDFQKLYFAGGALFARARMWKDRAKELDSAITTHDAHDLEQLAKCLERAREDYVELGVILRAQMALVETPSEEFQGGIAYADASAEVIDLNERKFLRNEAVDEGRIEALRKVIRGYESTQR